MARSYFAVNDHERAEREFRAVLAARPPPEVQALAGRYLDRMGRETMSPTRIAGYLDFTLGRDSNVNAATTSNALFAAVPAPGREADAFSALAAGAQVSHRLDARHTIFGGADFSQRMHFDRDEFDVRTADLHVGLNHRVDERDSIRLALEQGEYELDYSAYRRIRGGSAQWTRQFDERARLSFVGQAVRVRFSDAPEQSLSSDLILFGVRGARAFGRAARNTLFGSVFIGYDEATHGRLDGDRRLLGLSATLQRRLAPRLEGYASASLIDSSYRQVNPAAGLTRGDHYASAELGLSWDVGGGWRVLPRLLRTHNRSNLPATEYARTEASLTLRRAWE
jgi:hypothetical protein